MTKSPLPLVLASGSPYRRTLLETLGIEFSCATPNIDESQLLGESPKNLVERLSKTKILHIAATHPNTILIGSDQIGALENHIFGQPGTMEQAILQLQMMSGKAIDFHTGVAVLNAQTKRMQCFCQTSTVFFRKLKKKEIIRYLKAEKPFNCAGSFKSERLGITLVQKIKCEDPSSLIGLPLITLAQMLRNEGMLIP